MVFQTVLFDRPGSFVAVQPNPFAEPPYDQKPWLVRLYEMDHFDLDEEADFDDVEQARAYAEQKYRIRPETWMEAERPGSPHTLASILAPLWQRAVTEEELNCVIRLTYSQLPLDELGYPVLPCEDAGVMSIRMICYGLFGDLDRLRGPAFESLEALGYDYVFQSTGNEGLETTEAFARIKAEITRAGRISRWLPLPE